VPGLTNRWLGRWVDRIALSFPGSEAAFGGRGVVTGNPVRTPFFEIAPWTGPRGRLRILIFGGSRGARSLNRAAVAALPLLADVKDRLAIVHQTGESDLPEAARVRGVGFRGGAGVAFIDDMPARLEARTRRLRSGAGTVSACGRGAGLGLVPIPSRRPSPGPQRQWIGTRGRRSSSPTEMDGARLAAIVRDALASPGLRRRGRRALSRVRRRGGHRVLTEGIMKGARLKPPGAYVKRQSRYTPSSFGHTRHIHLVGIGGSG
jgi:UDP-N-acetylglucosamine--N-acetylmuramyl-(pentapeptide) pyrophosphoryl-undecaprenol N-acetylglucosamine transferase